MPMACDRLAVSQTSFKLMDLYKMPFHIRQRQIVQCLPSKGEGWEVMIHTNVDGVWFFKGIAGIAHLGK